MTAPDDMNTSQNDNTAGATASGQPAAPPLPADALPSDALIVLPTRNLVLFPEMVFPLAMGRPATIAAAQQAVREQRQVLVALQRDPEKSEVVPGDLHQIGEVELTLRVSGADFPERDLQEIFTGHVKTWIDAAHCTLVCGGIFMLPDRADTPASVTENTAVARRVAHLGGDHR